MLDGKLLLLLLYYCFVYYIVNVKEWLSLRFQIIGLLNVFTPQKTLEEFQDV